MDVSAHASLTGADEQRWSLPVYEQLGLEPVAAEGLWLETADGRRVLDLYGGHAVAVLGHRHPRLTRAIAEQARVVGFQSNLLPMAVRSRALAALAGIAPPGLDHAFLVNSGAEANENGLRLALKLSGRGTVVAVEGAFHGRTAAAGAVTWKSAGWYGFPRTPFDVRFVPVDDAHALAAAVDEDTAAVILEPVQGVAGARALAPEFLRAARELTADAGAWLIFDEVQCGMGRSGHPFVAQAVNVTPDILITAKGLAGGFPAGAMLVGAETAARLKPGDLGTTFGGGPMACAAIAVVAETLAEPGFLAGVRETAALLRERCLTGPVTGTTGLGLLAGLTGTMPARRLRDALLARDILAGTSADPAVLRLLPPLTLGAEHVALLAAALEDIGPDEGTDG